MPVQFDGADDAITLALGALGFAFGPGSIAVICFPDAGNEVRHLLHVGTDSGSTRYGLNLSGTDTLRMQIGSGSRTAPTIVASEDEWNLLGCSKAAGTVACRFHKYLWSSGVHSHEDDDVTGASSGVPTGDAFIGNVLGSGGSDGFLGEILLGAIWDVVLTDAQFEALPHSVQAWFAPAQPKLLFFLDQEGTSLKVIDVSGNGSNESARTGTTIDGRSAPPFASGVDAILAEVLASGGGSFTIDVGGALSPGGALAKAIGKPLTATTAPSGAVNKSTAKALTGTLLPAGSASRATGKVAAGSLGPSGALSKSAGKLTGGSITPSGALAKGAAKLFGGALAPASSLATLVLKAIFVGGAISPAGSLARGTSKALAGAVEPQGALAKAASKGFAGVIAPVGGLLTEIGQAIVARWRWIPRYAESRRLGSRDRDWQ